MDFELVKQFAEDQSDRVLWPLRRGEMVFLTVNDPKILRKERISVPTLMLAEMPMTDRVTLICALPGYGCEVMPVWDMRAGKLVRVGLSARSAKVLIRELEKLYEVHKDGYKPKETSRS